MLPTNRLSMCLLTHHPQRLHFDLFYLNQSTNKVIDWQVGSNFVLDHCYMILILLTMIVLTLLFIYNFYYSLLRSMWKRSDCFHPFTYIRLFFCAKYFKNSSAVSLVPRISSTTILDNSPLAHILCSLLLRIYHRGDNVLSRQPFKATHSLGHGNFSFWEIVKISNAQKTYFLWEKT